MSDPVKGIMAHIRLRCVGLAETELRHRESAPWQTLLFDGGRHRIIVSLSGERIDDALATLRDEIAGEELDLPGHIVTEIGLAGIEPGADETLVRIDAVTVAV